jgi:hypothetical protein
MEEKIKKIISEERLIKNRVKRIEGLGVACEERPMGSGGVGQTKETKDEIRIQVGYGHGRHNYAMCAIINKEAKNAI